jgi:hypothetical protein
VARDPDLDGLSRRRRDDAADRRSAAIVVAALVLIGVAVAALVFSR